MQIRGTEYDWKEGNKNYSGHDIGVIAQDIEKVLPEAVSTKPDGTKGVHYNKLILLSQRQSKIFQIRLMTLKINNSQGFTYKR